MKRYDKSDNFSYAYGTFTGIELLESRPEIVMHVYYSSKLNSDLLTKIRNICEKSHIPCEQNDRGIEKIAAKENTYLLCVFKKFYQGLDTSRPHIVLVNPSDRGNIGTIMRTMLGFGIKDLAIIKDAVDVFNPLTVVATMGAMFKIRFQYFDSMDEYLGTYQSPNRKLFSFMLNSATSLQSVEKPELFTLIFGNEGAGLPDKYSTIAQAIKIPQSKDIDSLNLAISVGIALYEFHGDKV